MISKKMKYALKALTYLAKYSTKEKCIRTVEIAESESIPKKFLEQILLELKKVRFVNSKQGNIGGYYLLKPASEINLADIYRLFEGPIALVACASLNFYEPCEDCKDETACLIRKNLIKVRNQTLGSMQKITLDSLIEK